MAKKKAKAGGRLAKTSRKKAARKTAKAKAARRRVTRKKTVRRASKVAKKKMTRKPARPKAVKHAAKAPRKVAARAPAARPKRPRRTTATLPPEPRPITPPIVDVEPLARPPITPAPYTPPTPPAPPAPPAPAPERTGMETGDEEGGPTASSGGPADAGPKTGDLAPDFTLSDEQGRSHTLSQYRGQKVILYFYPKDDTPGCTAEACGFRDRLGSFTDRNAVVLGVSSDSVESHRRFVQKYGLNFPLLADEGHRVAEQYGVWVEKKRYGATSMGIARTTFVIGPDGRIEHVFRNVRPDGHELEVLQRLGL